MNRDDHTVESFREDLEHIINSNDVDKDAPDFILAQYLIDCLAAYEKAVGDKLYFDVNEKITKLDRLSIGEASGVFFNETCQILCCNECAKEIVVENKTLINCPHCGKPFKHGWDALYGRAPMSKS